ncbi:MAG: hypothetical protein GXX79_22580 [Actinomycetales bacterium]|nr:hypothetical protein [Actinomycetales bacterium]
MIFWVLLWTTLAVGALVAVALVVRSVWRSFTGLLDEVETATDRLAVAAEAAAGDTAPAPPELAVLADPGELRSRLEQARRGRPSVRNPRHRAEPRLVARPGQVG